MNKSVNIMRLRNNKVINKVVKENTDKNCVFQPTCTSNSYDDCLSDNGSVHEDILEDDMDNENEEDVVAEDDSDVNSSQEEEKVDDECIEQDLINGMNKLALDGGPDSWSLFETNKSIF